MPIRRRHLSAALLGILAGLARPVASFAQAGSPESAYVDIMGDRDRYGRVCHQFGDSIMYGYALGAFPEGGEVDPTDVGRTAGDDKLPLDHPLYAWRCPASAMRQIAAENRLSRFTAAYGGSMLLPVIGQLIDTEVIRDGDWVVLEDAGGHGTDPVAYFRQMRQWRRSVVDRVAVTCIMMTMFDYQPYHAELPDAEFDRRYPVGGGRTLSCNDAIRMAANSVYWQGAPPPGRTRLIDMNRHMDGFRRRLLQEDGVTTMHRDGIHPNCWGQWLLVRELFQAMHGPNLAALAIDDPLALVRANWRFLGYGTKSSTWTQERAVVRLRQLLDHA